ncbi:hypothetical protein G6011_00838 [Alternaria panax]|uniref:PHD-type domain-containing protein n=1 Tax=Alternaria panax TaxID=48097 RepID=A0AAD4IIV8_9PLEO|nr:hypothetical protein G6011_00838 [Alternaria panax]
MVSAEKAAGSFVLQVHGIRLPNGWQAPRGGRENDPAKKARTLLRVATSIKTSVVSSSPNPPCKNPPEQDAILRGTDRRSEREASIEMEPIVIYREDWYTDLSNIDETDIHGIMLSVNFENHDHLKDLFKFMRLDILQSTVRMSTSYMNIFDVPEGRVILPLKASGKHLGIGLEVSMYWNPLKRDSVLTSHNRHLRNTIEPASSYPTPPLDQEPRYKLTFVYGNDNLERSELMCPHCSKRKTTDVDDLKMHLISWHEYFDYHVTLEEVDEHGVEHWRFESKLANYKVGQRASDTADEPLDVRVLAPARPFDRRRYLAGDDEFERTARIEMPTSNVKTKPATSGSKVAPGSRLRKPPDQVQLRPKREKKKFVVPKAPKGITFFRSISKRPLQPGEVISESDDELDEGWMYCRKHAEIYKTGLSEPAKRFLKLYDDFMHEENLQSEIHVGESIVRFARERGPQMHGDNDLVGEFKKKIDELLEEDLVSKDVAHEALEMVENQKWNVKETTELSERLAHLDVEYQETAPNPAGNGIDNGFAPASDRMDEWNARVSNFGYDRDYESRPVLHWVAESHDEAFTRESASKKDVKGKGKTTDTSYLSYPRRPGLDWDAEYIDQGFDKEAALKKDRKGKGKAVMTKAGYLTPVNGDYDGDVDMSDKMSISMSLEPLETPQDEDADPPYDLCYCGEDASATRGESDFIACNNVDCIRRIFHLACIQQHTKTPLPTLAPKTRDWTCDECKANSHAAR